MSPALPAKYLHVLQDGVIRRLGAKGELSVDVRVVAATNRDAAQAVQDKTLREDLYNRINVLSISLPPLRKRLDDLNFLIDAFIAEFNEKYQRQVKTVDDATQGRLREHGRPGNVRELRNIIQRTLESVKNNKARAAAILGTTPKTLHDKSRRWPCEAAETAGS